MSSRDASLPDEQASDVLSIRSCVLEDGHAIARDPARKSDRGLIEILSYCQVSEDIAGVKEARASAAGLQVQLRTRRIHRSDQHGGYAKLSLSPLLEHSGILRL